MVMIDTGKEVVISGVGARSVGLKFLVEKVANASIQIASVQMSEVLILLHSNSRGQNRSAPLYPCPCVRK